MGSVRVLLLGVVVFSLLPACGGDESDPGDDAGDGGSSNPAAGSAGAGQSSGGLGGGGSGGGAGAGAGMAGSTTGGVSAGGAGGGPAGAAGSAGSAGVPGLADDPTGITADRNCALAQAGSCVEPITRTKDEVCARWKADFPKRAAEVYVGSDVACDAGETMLEAQDDAVRRMNLVRWLAGLDPVTLNQEWSEYASTCAVIQAYLVPDITHYPETTATCYTQMGGDASAQSQIAGVPWDPADAMMGLIWDWGDNNLHILGHRHGILYPGVTEVGVGSSYPPDAYGATCVRSFDGMGVYRMVPYDLVSSANYIATAGSPLEWSISTGDDITISGVRMYRETDSAYEPFAIESGDFLKEDYAGRWILPATEPVPPGTYVAIVDTASGTAFGYRVRLERCGPDVPLTCDVLAQDCGTAGYGCYQVEAPVCAESGDTPNGESCSGLDTECEPGSTCQPDFNDLGALVCTPYCDLEDASSPKACATLCPGNEVQVFGEELEPIGAFCEVGTGGACDPLMPSCETGQSCYDFEPAACGPVGTLMPGADCVRGLSENCVPGYTCAGIAGESMQYCLPYCDFAPGATGPDACSTLCPDAYWDFVTYGLCMPPE
jgi:hypothetical protein